MLNMFTAAEKQRIARRELILFLICILGILLFVMLSGCATVNEKWTFKDKDGNETATLEKTSKESLLKDKGIEFDIDALLFSVTTILDPSTMQIAPEVKAIAGESRVKIVTTKNMSYECFRLRRNWWTGKLTAIDYEHRTDELGKALPAAVSINVNGIEDTVPADISIPKIPTVPDPPK